MRWVRDLSLKFKLILLLVLLTSSMLTAYGFIALRDFEKDKIAYVLDSSLAHSRSTALQIQAELTNTVDRVKFLMRGYAADANTFHPFTVSIFPQEAKFDAFMTYAADGDGHYRPQAILQKPALSAENLQRIRAVAEAMQADVLENDLAIAPLGTGSSWVLGLRFDLPNQPDVIVVSTLNSSHFMGLFESAQMQDSYVVAVHTSASASGGTPTLSLKKVISPTNTTYSVDPNLLTKAFTEAALKLQSPEGIFQFPAPQKEEWLISVASVGVGHLRIMSVVPRSAALAAVKTIMIKSALFLAFLFFVTIFLSVLTSTTLTASLKRLLVATRRMAAGDFSTVIEIKSEDEVGSLSRGFNFMAEEIQRLLKDTVEKARMEGELKTAQLVQSTLFPQEHSVEADLEIRGFYQPASECSGDWWFYKRIGDQTLFCIGDATGHGVPAALLTAAARSAASALESFPDLPLSEMMMIFNKAIHNTARGQVMMTLFLGAYNHSTGIVSYTNASHEPPYLLPNKEGLKKKDLQLLNEVNGPRLGEKADSIYPIAQVQMQQGDRIMLYTDGVTELKNEAGEMWSERALIKCLISSTNDKKDLTETMSNIAKELSTFRQDHPLHDDVTYFMVTRSKSA